MSYRIDTVGFVLKRTMALERPGAHQAEGLFQEEADVWRGSIPDDR